EIAARIQTQHTAIAEAERALTKASLGAALSPSPLDVVAKERAAVADAREVLALLQSALTEAEAAEKKRLEDAQTDARAAALRAGRQHLSRGIKCAQELSTAMSNMLAAYHRLLECADAAARVLPPGQANLGWEKLGVAHLSRVVADEFARVCTWNPVALPRIHNF